MDWRSDPSARSHAVSRIRATRHVIGHRPGFEPGLDPKVLRVRTRIHEPTYPTEARLCGYPSQTHRATHTSRSKARRIGRDASRTSADLIPWEIRDGTLGPSFVPGRGVSRRDLGEPHPRLLGRTGVPCHACERVLGGPALVCSHVHVHEIRPERKPDPFLRSEKTWCGVVCRGNRPGVETPNRRTWDGWKRPSMHGIHVRFPQRRNAEMLSISTHDQPAHPLVPKRACTRSNPRGFVPHAIPTDVHPRRDLRLATSDFPLPPRNPLNCVPCGSHRRVRSIHRPRRTCLAPCFRLSTRSRRSEDVSGCGRMSESPKRASWQGGDAPGKTTGHPFRSSSRASGARRGTDDVHTRRTSGERCSRAPRLGPRSIRAIAACQRNEDVHDHRQADGQP